MLGFVPPPTMTEESGFATAGKALSGTRADVVSTRVRQRPDMNFPSIACGQDKEKAGVVAEPIESFGRREIGVELLQQAQPQPAARRGAMHERRRRKDDPT